MKISCDCGQEVILSGDSGVCTDCGQRITTCHECEGDKYLYLYTLGGNIVRREECTECSGTGFLYQ